MSAPFRQRNALHQWQLHFGPNMTPMVDVVMVILVFFMAGTALVGPEWLLRVGLAPPSKAPAGYQLGPADLLIQLEPSPQGPVFSGLGRTQAPLPELLQAAEAASQQLGSAIDQTRITIDPDPDVSYEAVIRAHEALTKAEFPAVAIR